MRRTVMLAALTALPFAIGCSSSTIEDAIDGTLQRRIDTMKNCFPSLFDKAGFPFDIANLWRMRTSAPVPDPAELTWSEQPDGSIEASAVDSGVTVMMTIRFYSPSGDVQDLDLSNATTLSAAISAAATQLAQMFGFTKPFMVGDWTISGTGLSGSGAFTGVIGGSANGNELETLSTTTATPAGGVPPFANGMVTSTANNVTCQLMFRTENLQTDTQVDQQYPIGTITVTVSGEEVVNATITMNNTAVARIDVNDIPGHFDFNLDTGNLDYVP